MNKLINTVLTLGKVAVKSRFIRKPSVDVNRGHTLVIMGNGPSLRETLASDAGVLERHDTMAVNFAANTPEFFNLKPTHYVLADPHFFSAGDKAVDALWENLRKADWDMTLHVPVTAKVPPGMPSNIRFRRFNMTPGEGYDFVTHRLFRSGLAIPRPRNVLVPALMEAVREGYGEIFIVGADHSWPHSLYVDDRNRVVSVQPHFYKDDPAELDRIAEVYAGVKIHDVLGSMVVAFRSYHEIARYARRRGVEIFNATPGSLIDAFPRKKPRC